MSNTVMKTSMWKAEMKFTSKYMNIQKVVGFFCLFCLFVCGFVFGFFLKDISLYMPAGMPLALSLAVAYFQILNVGVISSCWKN